jgi:DNA replication protein DnaC
MLLALNCCAVELRLPAIKLMPAARHLAAVADQKVTDRARRRIERHLTDARLPVGKTLDTFDFEAVPTISKAQVMALGAADFVVRMIIMQL